MANDLIPTFIGFFEYIEAIQDGDRLQKFLVRRLIQKQTLETISDDRISKERVSQIIGKRKNNSENVWNSEEGKNFTRRVSLFLDGIIGKTELRVTDILSSNQLQLLGLSHLDLCQFVCGMIEERIIVGNYHAEITPTNQFLICDKEIYSILKKLDRIFHADYREFMYLEKFCRLGELEKVADAWFYPDFKIFKNLYLTKNGKIGSRNWSIEKFIEAIAWELADKLDYYYWHYSEMCEALNYLFPTKFGETHVRQVNTRLSSNRDKFQFAGSKGCWQLTDLGDGYHNNKDAIIKIFRASDKPLYYKNVVDELRKWGVALMKDPSTPCWTETMHLIN